MNKRSKYKTKHAANSHAYENVELRRKLDYAETEDAVRKMGTPHQNRMYIYM